MQFYDKKCVICSKPFNTYKRNKFVCSLICQQEYNRRYMRELMRKKRAEEKITFLQTCNICKKQFRVSKPKAGCEVVCFECKYNKRKIFERDYSTAGLTGELKPVSNWYE